MNLHGKTILVVGASGVFGAMIADQLAKSGARVLGTASSNESASRIPVSAELRLLLDLDSQQSISTLVDYLLASERLDGVVLAAGRVGFGRMDATPSEGLRLLTQVNYLGQAELVTRFLPILNDQSFVVAITGVVAEKTFPGMSAYCASKTAMSAWLNATSSELRRVGVQAIEVRPGHTETGLANRPAFGVAPTMPAGMTPEHVVQKIINAIAERTALLASTDF